MVVLIALVACAARVRLALPDAPAGPQWPPAPATPRVAWLASVAGVGGGFGRPVDVACGPGPVVAVADVERAQVQVLDFVHDRVRVIQSAAGAPLGEPVGVAWADGELFVADASRRAVFAARGRGPLRAVAVGALVRPTDVLRAGGVTYVVDLGAHVVVTAAADGGLARIGDRGPVGTGLNYPVRAAVAADGSVLVADAGNAAISRVDAAGVTFFAGGLGRGGELLVQPKGVAIDPRGRVHVVDAAMQHVQVYEPDGTFAGRYGGPGEGDGELGLPGGLCIDPDGRVFVADSLHRRVQVYQILDLAEGSP